MQAGAEPKLNNNNNDNDNDNDNHSTSYASNTCYSTSKHDHTETQI